MSSCLQSTSSAQFEIFSLALVSDRERKRELVVKGRSNKRRIDNGLIVRVDPIEFGKVGRVHVLEDHERVAVERRQFDSCPRENRIEVLCHPRIFLTL